MDPREEKDKQLKENQDFSSEAPEGRAKEKDNIFIDESEEQLKKRQSHLPAAGNVVTPSRIPNQTIKKLWSDPVISKLIATIIVYFSPFLLAFLLQLNHEWKILDSVRKILLYSLPIWLYVVVIAFMFLSFQLYKFVKKKYFHKNSQGFPFGDTIGNYKFWELFNSLLDMPAMQEHSYLLMSQEKPQSLLEAFLVYLPMYNMEVDIKHRDSSLLYFRIGPLLISYGLLEYVVSKDIVANKDQWVIRPTKDGYKFYAYCAKYRLYVDFMEKETSKRVEKKMMDDKEKKD